MVRKLLIGATIAARSGTTRIERLNYDEVVVSGDNTTGPKSVPRTEFKRLLEFWDRYKQGIVSRDELQKISRNTTYILSILLGLRNLSLGTKGGKRA
jgi:hypothetical protein